MKKIGLGEFLGAVPQHLPTGPAERPQGGRYGRPRSERNEHDGGRWEHDRFDSGGFRGRDRDHDGDSEGRSDRGSFRRPADEDVDDGPRASDEVDWRSSQPSRAQVTGAWRGNDGRSFRRDARGFDGDRDGGFSREPRRFAEERFGERRRYDDRGPRRFGGDREEDRERPSRFGAAPAGFPPPPATDTRPAHLRFKRGGAVASAADVSGTGEDFPELGRPAPSPVSKPESANPSDGPSMGSVAADTRSAAAPIGAKAESVFGAARPGKVKDPFVAEYEREEARKAAQRREFEELRKQGAQAGVVSTRPRTDPFGGAAPKLIKDPVLLDLEKSRSATLGDGLGSKMDPFGGAAPKETKDTVVLAPVPGRALRRSGAATSRRGDDGDFSEREATPGAAAPRAAGREARIPSPAAAPVPANAVPSSAVAQRQIDASLVREVVAFSEKHSPLERAIWDKAPVDAELLAMHIAELNVEDDDLREGLVAAVVRALVDGTLLFRDLFDILFEIRPADAGDLLVLMLQGFIERREPRELKELVDQSEVALMDAIIPADLQHTPEGDKWLEDQGLLFLKPVANVTEEVTQMLSGKKSASEILRLVNDRVDEKLSVSYLGPVVARHVFALVFENKKTPNTDVLDAWVPLLRRCTQGDEEAQMRVIFVAQGEWFAATNGTDRASIQAIFKNLLKAGVCSSKAFVAWADDKQEKTIKGKGPALIRTTDFLTELRDSLRPEVEDDDDDDDYDDDEDDY